MSESSEIAANMLEKYGTPLLRDIEEARTWVKTHWSDWKEYISHQMLDNTAESVVSQSILLRVKERMPGYYTERDGGDWYVLTPHHDRLAQEFYSRNDARRFILWLSGDDLPTGWTFTPHGDGHLSFDLDCKQGYPACVWIRAVRRNFPSKL